MAALPASVLILAAVAVCVSPELPSGELRAAEPARELVGRILLPPGDGSRGVEVILTLAETGGERRDVWLPFDGRGRFAHTFRGSPIRVTVSTGIRAELHRIDTDDLPEVDGNGRIDVGGIDLRDRLATHRLVVRAAEGAPPGDVRIALCFGPPPVGPGGGRVALGSRQFPPVSLGSEVEWLLPHDARAVHFLVERPRDPGGNGPWRTGRQRLFGPFTSATLPAELRMD
jgi:hypothetical protein